MPTTIAREGNYTAAEQMRGAYPLHIFKHRKHFDAFMQATHPAAKFVGSSDARGRMFPAYDHRENYMRDLCNLWEREDYDTTGEYNEMSNATATPQAAEVKYTGAQLMQEIAKLRSETKANADRNQANWTALVQDLEKAKRDLFHENGQHRTEIASLKAQVANLQTALLEMGEPEDRWTPEQRAAAQNPPAQQTPASGKKITRQTINITQIVKAVDDKGKEFYRAKGGRFMQFGIAIYPEALKACKIDPALLKFGPNDCDQGMIAEFEDDKPRRVIGLAKIF